MPERSEHSTPRRPTEEDIADLSAATIEVAREVYGTPHSTPQRASHNHPTPTFDRKPEGECPRCDELTDQENAIVRWTPRPTRGLFG